MDPEETTQPNADAGASPEPAAVSFDPSAFQESLNSEFNKRFSGIQSMTDRKLEELKETIAELRAANLTPEEQEQFEVTQARNRAEALERENALLRMRKDHPEEVDFLDGFFKQKTLQEQLGFLANFRKAPAPEATEPAAQTTPTPVSGNNAPRKATPTVADAGSGEMNDALADQILNAAGNEPGLLRKLFRR